MTALRGQLAAGSEAMGLALSEAQLDALLAYVDELLRWNARINLTAVTEASEVISHHILDSLAVAPFLGDGPLLDVGSGAGLPSLPLAILRPELRFTSIESRHKKCAFQRQAARALGLANHQVVTARVEDWTAPVPFAQIISRAFSSLALFAQLAGRHLAPDGQLLAMKGREPVAEREEMSPAWRLVKMHRLTVPGLSAERHLLVYDRAAADSSSHPHPPLPGG